MRSLLSKFLLAAVLVAPSLSAQGLVHFKYNGPGAGYNANGVYIGTYSGTQNYGTEFASIVGLNCVDYFHEVFRGEEWDAHITRLVGDDLRYTRHPLSLAEYKEAAWLISNYTQSNVQATQSTIWNLFGTPGTQWPSDATLLASAQNAPQEFDYSKFYVVTDARANGNELDDTVQEFMVYDPSFIAPAGRSNAESYGESVAPEPSSTVLLGSGLLAFVGFRARRRKTVR